VGIVDMTMVVVSVAGNIPWTLILSANFLGPQRGPNFQPICRQGSGGTAPGSPG